MNPLRQIRRSDTVRVMSTSESSSEKSVPENHRRGQSLPWQHQITGRDRFMFIVGMFLASLADLLMR